jgi:hypothetical protein
MVLWRYGVYYLVTDYYWLCSDCLIVAGSDLNCEKAWRCAGSSLEWSDLQRDPVGGIFA